MWRWAGNSEGRKETERKARGREVCKVLGEMGKSLYRVFQGQNCSLWRCEWREHKFIYIYIHTYKNLCSLHSHLHKDIHIQRKTCRANVHLFKTLHADSWEHKTILLSGQLHIAVSRIKFCITAEVFFFLWPRIFHFRVHWRLYWPRK